ncbi:RNA 3'-terminal phosphate cyclase [Candidatus Woesearchaeota archaeon]|nr:RNA 3'-terminal phosphate cyclase [Candidatus Woesearchaeota archaeon]
MLSLDGSYGEGGGQIVRTALALSALTGKSFEVVDIRKGRKQPGLKAQHLQCIKALEQLCSAKSEHAKLGSDKLRFTPGKISGKTVTIDIGTAGSISLLMQSLLLPSIFADRKVSFHITGGTSGKWAMPVDYFSNVFAQHLKKFCEKIDIKLLKRGYYPKGGGQVEIVIKPRWSVSNFEEFFIEMKKQGPFIDIVEQGTLLQIKGISHASKLLENSQVAERQANAAQVLLSKYQCPVQIRTEYCDTRSMGSGITLWGIFSEGDEIDFSNPVIIGSDSLGERGKKAELVGREAAENLIKEIDSYAAADSYLADNLVPFLVFGGKIKTSKITNHCKTNIWVCEQFLGKMFKIDEENKVISV